jgi:hexosaminidase
VRRTFAALTFAVLLTAGGAAPAPSAVEPELQVIPLPREASRSPGVFALGNAVTIEALGEEERAIASLLAADLHGLHIAATIAATPTATAAIRLLKRAGDPALGNEGYRLTVDDKGIAIAGNGGAGLFYGAQTLVQLASAAGPPANAVPHVRIVDRPQYRWRGIHLDVSRHFFPVPVVERYIDLAARYKLNVFHWHLTDDQGWRIEIKRYPNLASIGGCRAGTQVGGEGSTATDGRRYCGSYSQSQIRDVVEYARRRYVAILPEIEMPGHSVEALAAYPWLGCGSGGYRVRELWGVSADIFCPTERTFAFIDNVLGEVAALFPGAYLHIGGDEVPKDAWKSSPAVARLRRREHLRTYDDVQGYFTRRVEKIARTHRRSIVGWDEILDGGVSPQATVMSWRGTDGGVRAAKRGNDVVMSPDGPLYLDAYQGNADYEPLAIGGLATLKMVYDYDPLPKRLSPDAARHILGAQANLWTEYVPTDEQLFYMLLPRELALAELCWTPRDRMSWDGFTARLGGELRRLEAKGNRYRIPLVTFAVQAPGGVEFPEQQPVENNLDVSVPADSSTVVLRETVPDASIHYTLDGTTPKSNSPIYAAPLHLSLSEAHAVTVAAIAVLPSGRAGAPSFLNVTSSGAPKP